MDRDAEQQQQQQQQGYDNVNEEEEADYDDEEEDDGGPKQTGFGTTAEILTDVDVRKRSKGYNPPVANISAGLIWNDHGFKKNMPGTGTGFRAAKAKAEIVLRQQEEGAQQAKKKRTKFEGLFEILFSFVGHTLEIELKNDDIVTGIVSSSTTSMDIFLENVKEVRGCDGTVTYLESTLIKGSSIRYVHFAAHENVLSRLTAFEKIGEMNKNRKSTMSVLNGRIEGETTVLNMF